MNDEQTSRWHFAAVAILIGLGLAAGCSSADSNERVDRDAASSCEPGATTDCRCSNGTAGQQACQTDGTWGACECSDTGRDAGADVAAPSDTSSEASWRHPSDPDRTLVAKRLEPNSSIQIDGTFDEPAYGAAMRVALEGSEAAVDNRVTIRSTWSSNRLYLAARIEDDSVEAPADPDLWERDSVEFFVDTGHEGDADQLASGDYQVLVDAEGRTANRVGSPDGRQPDDSFDFAAATSTFDGGYRVEVAIAWEQLATDPREGDRMGFLFANNDRDGGTATSSSWGGVEPFANPAAWGDLRLGGLHPGSFSPDGDTDTGTERDASPANDAPDDTSADPNAPGCNIFPDPPGSNVVDLGNKGLSPGDEIDPYLEEWLVPGNEVHVPAGSYEWNGDGTSSSPLDESSLIGDGEVVLDTGGGHTWSANFMAEGDAEVRNITVKGVAGNTPGKHGKLRFWAPASDATLVARNVDQPDGSEPESGRVGIYVPSDHAGSVYFVDCHIEGFANNGIYASSPGHGEMGDVHVIRGLYKNNNIANVRLGTDDSSARGVVSLQTDSSPVYTDGGLNQRGFWVRERGDDIRLENIHAVQTVSATSGAVLIQSRPGGGSGTLNGVHVQNDVSQPAVDIATGDWSGSDIDVTGNGSDAVQGGSFSDVCQGSGCETPRTSPLPACP